MTLKMERLQLERNKSIIRELKNELIQKEKGITNEPFFYLENKYNSLKLLYSPEYRNYHDTLVKNMCISIIKNSTCNSDENQTQLFDAYNFLFDGNILEYNLNNSANGNYEKRRILECYLSSLLNNQKYTSKNFEKWFFNPSVLGAESANGVVYRSSFPKKNPKYFFAIKIPKPTRQKSNLYPDIYIEGAVGLNVLNSIKKIIPNFVYTYAFTENCGVPKIINGITKLCTAIESNIPYIITENITNSVSLGTYIRDARNFLAIPLISCLFQISNALQIAYEIADFTHYDLHPGNILIKTLDKPLVIPFFSIFDNTSLMTDKLAYIIDYGNCTFRLHNSYIGKSYGKNIGIVYNESRPFFDIYRLYLLILSLLNQRISIENNFDVKRELKSAYEYIKYMLENGTDHVINAEYIINEVNYITNNNINTSSAFRKRFFTPPNKFFTENQKITHQSFFSRIYTINKATFDQFLQNGIFFNQPTNQFTIYNNLSNILISNETLPGMINSIECSQDMVLFLDMIGTGKNDLFDYIRKNTNFSFYCNELQWCKEIIENYSIQIKTLVLKMEQFYSIYSKEIYNEDEINDFYRHEYSLIGFLMININEYNYTKRILENGLIIFKNEKYLSVPKQCANLFSKCLEFLYKYSPLQNKKLNLWVHKIGDLTNSIFNGYSASFDPEEEKDTLYFSLESNLSFFINYKDL